MRFYNSNLIEATIGNILCILTCKKKKGGQLIKEDGFIESQYRTIFYCNKVHRVHVHKTKNLVHINNHIMTSPVDNSKILSAPLVVTNPDVIKYLICQLFTEAILVITFTLLVTSILYEEIRHIRKNWIRGNRIKDSRDRSKKKNELAAKEEEDMNKKSSNNNDKVNVKDSST